MSLAREAADPAPGLLSAAPTAQGAVNLASLLGLPGSWGLSLPSSSLFALVGMEPPAQDMHGGWPSFLCPLPSQRSESELWMPSVLVPGIPLSEIQMLQNLQLPECQCDGARGKLHSSPPGMDRRQSAGRRHGPVGAAAWDSLLIPRQSVVQVLALPLLI